MSLLSGYMTAILIFAAVRTSNLTQIIVYLLTYSMEQGPSWETSWFSASQFPSFYGTRNFITVFTRARHLSLFWARSVHPMRPHSTSWRPILILSSHLRLDLQSCLFPQVSKPIPCIHHSPPQYLLHVPPISFFLIDHPNKLWWGVQIIRLLII